MPLILTDLELQIETSAPPHVRYLALFFFLSVKNENDFNSCNIIAQVAQPISVPAQPVPAPTAPTPAVLEEEDPAQPPVQLSDDDDADIAGLTCRQACHRQENLRCLRHRRPTTAPVAGRGPLLPGRQVLGQWVPAPAVRAQR